MYRREHHGSFSLAEMTCPSEPLPAILACVKAFLSYIYWLFVGTSSVPMFVIAALIRLVTAPFDRCQRALHQFTCFWASIYSWINPAWRVVVQGREKVKKNVAYVMVANHASLLDILVMFRLFVHFKWVSKIEAFRVPFIGWNMSLNRYVKLKRGDAPSIKKMLAACEDWIRKGSSIMMFPEGTRSRTGKLRRFKHGAFTLARRTGAPILPIVIEGTSKALPVKGVVLKGLHDIRIRILDEIPIDSWEDLSPEAMAEKVQQIFASELARAPAAAG